MTVVVPQYDIIISGLKSGVSPSQVEVVLIDWRVVNYKHEIRFLVDSTQKRNTIREYITPGAVDKAYDILGQPTFWDLTYSNANTVKIIPVSTQTSTIANLRSSIYLGVETFEDQLLSPEGVWLVTLSGYEVEII